MNYKMKILLILMMLCFGLIGCVTYNIWNPPIVEEIDPMELFGKEGEPLQGRLFSSFCESNAFGNSSTARNTAITNAAKRANDLGFSYFTIIWDNVGSTMKAGSYNTYYHPSRNQTIVTTNYYNYKFYVYQCIFIVLNNDELEGWDHIYSVSRYVKE